MAADVTEQNRTEAALATRLQQQTVITRLSQTALSGLDLNPLFDQATGSVAQSLNVEFVKILQLQPQGEALKLISGVGWQPGLVGRVQVPANHDSQAGYTLLANGPVVVRDLPIETRFSGPTLLTQHGVVSGISTIIQGVDGRPFGVLGAHSCHHHTFTQNDIDFLQAVANLLAAAIRRKDVEQQVHHLNQQLEQRVHDRIRDLEAVNQELEAFSYSVAHDLRAPLRSIQGFAQVLVEEYDPILDDQGKDYIHRMALSAEHLDTLVQDLLTYSRLSRTAVHLQPVSLTTLIDDILQDMEPTLTALGATVKVTPHLPTVKAQRSILRQVLINLIDNGLKFVAPAHGPQLKIWAKVEGLSPQGLTAPRPWVRLWVEDRGIGIDPSHQTRIFEAFERLHGVEAYSGTGIGLAIVQRGMGRMGGTVGLESDLGQGSRFWIELPLAQSSPA